jgi:Protein of unknown function (DUF3303)
MKLVVTWTERAGGSAAENEASVARFLEVLSKWSPPSDQTFHQFVVRADGRGGFAVVETDNLAGVALSNFKFDPFLEFAVYPVLDVQEATGLLAEAAEFRKSIT